ncbi:MAG: tyrosine-type recombinase/integrase, partial [Rhodospirillaceae bacterium]|nr:tyrosine-type recombinase/integrase [Rhodospirillaceae bacterium]
ITVQELRRHRARQSEYFLKLGVRVGNDGPVFATLKDDDTIGPMTPRSLTKSFTRLIKDVDIPQITLHGLRHSHITHLLMDNAPIKLVSARAGHSTVAITLDVYGHVLPDKQQEVADSYGDALSLALAEQDRNG